MSSASVETLTKALHDLEIDENPCIKNEDVWKAIQLFYEANGAAKHSIESFNSLVYTLIPAVVDKFKNTVIEEGGKKYEIELSDVTITRPTFSESDGASHAIYPMECYDRNITYAGSIHIDTTITPPDGEPTVHQNVHWGNLPILVKSDACNLAGISNDPQKLAKHREDIFDQGGYFVVKGTRKILVGQERPAYNTVYVFTSRKSSPKFDYYAEVRSAVTDNANSTKTTVGYMNNKFGCLIPWIEMSSIPMGVLFRALGASSPEEIAHHVLGEKWKEDTQALNLLIPSLEFSYECNSQISALHYIGKRGKRFAGTSEGENEELEEDDMYGMLTDYEEENIVEDKEIMQDSELDAETQVKNDAISYARRLLSTELLPHMGIGEESYLKKRWYLGYMIRKVLYVVLGRSPSSDRDHYNVKRIMLVGPLLVQQFASAMRRQYSEIIAQTRKALRVGQAVNILSWIKPSTITNSLVGAIANNNWSIKGAAAQGISQTYEQFNFTGGLANGRKLGVPMSKEGGKIIAPRQLHSSHWAACCIAETPEGRGAGLIKNLALSACITTGSDATPVIELILTTNVVLFDNPNFNRKYSSLTKIFVNGAWIASTLDPVGLANTLRGLRREGGLNVETSIYHSTKHQEIHISTEVGRICRPLIIVENGVCKLTPSHIEKIDSREIDWMHLLTSGVVELIDKMEEEGAYVVYTPSDLQDLRENDVEKCMRVTHCEMHPALIFGIGGSIIPSPHRNQSPRNCYQCIWKEEPVLMANGQWKKIKDVKIDEEVVTFNPETMEESTTRVVNHLVRKTEKPIYQATTNSGRVITATGDHKFMTWDGWTELAKCIPGKTLMAINLAPYEVDRKISSREETPDACRVMHNTIFVPLSTLEEVENVEIADITTASPNHSFIAASFCVHNSAMGKQAIGTPFANYSQVHSGSFHVMDYVQRPLALSRSASIIQFDKMPSGLNAMVCIMPFRYNQEDALDLNGTSMDRGFMVSTKYICYYLEIRPHKGEEFCIPNAESCHNFKGDASKLEEDAFVAKGTIVKDGDILIGKRVAVSDPASTIHKKPFTNMSVVYQHPLPGVVHSVQYGLTGDEYPYVRVVVLQRRRPEVADKFCLTGDHEVLTSEGGWVRISQITVKHKVACLNPNNNDITFEQPLETHSFSGEKLLVQAYGPKVDLLVTLNHKMWACANQTDDKYQLIEAASLIDKEVYFQTPDGCRVAGYCTIVDGRTSGKVYCLTVPNHIFLVRRNGKALWTGNSARHG